jgi:hypothetical protein
MMKGSWHIKARNLTIVIATIALSAAVFVPSLPAIAAPVISLTPSSGAVGTTVTISGTVFNSYEGDIIYIFFDTDEIEKSPMVVPVGGNFTTSFTVPGDASAGQHWVEIKMDPSEASYIARSAFNVDETVLTLSSTKGVPGAAVMVSGSGFYVGSQVIIYYDNPDRQQVGVTAASATGGFTYSVIVPPSPAGTHKVSASNEQGNTAETEFTVVPTLKLNLDSAGPGDLLNVRGMGFAASSTVNIFLGQTSVAMYVTDELGSFEIDIEIPDLMPLTYEIKAQDDKGNNSTAGINVIAGMKLSEDIGSVGRDITLHGIGFTPGATIIINYDGEPFTTVIADNNGDFTIVITVPPGSGGEHIITVSDGATTREYPFAVETEPPAAPVFLLPGNGSLTRAEAYFDWLDVEDDSVPVTYDLEIASDQNFASPVLLKTGITESQYTLTGDEALVANFKNASYFWRVKAIDGAGNTSEWSAAWVFYVSVPSVPTMSLPANDSAVEYPIRFSWNAVTSLSPPVTYDLQIASSLDFTSTVLVETGLKSSDILISKDSETKLKKGATYYWRVKAVDAAMNSSDWSPAGSFLFTPKSTFPSWAIYMLISIAAVIAILFAYRLGRKTAYRPDTNYL